MSNQEFKDIKWGTAMPVMARMGSAIVSLRAFGVCSLAVSNSQVFGERFSNADDVAPQVKPIMLSKLADALAEASMGKADVAELVATSADIAATVKAQAEPDLGKLGLTLTQFRIDAINKQ